MKKRSLQILAAGAVAALAVTLVPAAAANAATIVTNGNIYYGQGYTVKADGSPSGIPKYAGASIYDEQLSFSPDGSRLVLRSQAQSGPPTVVQTANADFTNRTTIVTASDYGFEEVGSPVWSPDGTKISVLLYTGYGSNARLATVNPDGTDLKIIAATTDLDTYRQNGSWYPDSKRLVYINNVNQLCTVSTVTTAKTCSNLPKASVTGAPYDGAFSSPTVSSDGQYVAMTLYVGTDIGGMTRYDIARTSTTGTGFVNLTKSAEHGQYRTPVWSPDGSTLAFGVSRATGSGLGLISKTGTGFTVVAGAHTPQAWQPKVVTVNDPSALTVDRVGYCGNNGGTSAWLNLKATWKADPKASVATYRIYENGTPIKDIPNTRLTAGTLSTSFSSTQWWPQDPKTLIYTVKGVTATGDESGPSNTVTITVPALDC